MSLSFIETKLSNLVIEFFNQLTVILGRKNSLALTSLISKVLYFIYKITPYKNFLEQNIQETLKLSYQESNIISKKHINSLLKNITDLFYFNKKEFSVFENLIEIKNQEYFIEALSENKPIIFISAHYGCWELIGLVLSMKFKANINVLVQRPTNKAFDDFFYNFRKKFNIETHYNEGFSQLKKLFKKVEAKECLGFLIDQHGESENIFGTFFNQEVSIPSVAINIAYKYDALIIPVFVNRLPNDLQQIVFLPKVSIDSKAEKKTELKRVAQELYIIIENFIKTKPDEWLWTYQRFNKLSKIV